MIIKNASVYTEDGIFLEKDIYIEGTRFVDCAEKVSDKTEIDAGPDGYSFPRLHGPGLLRRHERGHRHDGGL